MIYYMYCAYQGHRPMCRDPQCHRSVFASWDKVKEKQKWEEGAFGCSHCQADNTDFQINMIFFIWEELRHEANRV